MVSGQMNLTDDQKRALSIIKSGVNAFITGPAGVGKSALIKKIIHTFEVQHKNVIVCAPTGIAAVNIGGTTLHKAFGFSKGACFTKKTNQLSIRTPKLIRMADVILIDEVSMCRMDMMDAVCASIQKVRAEGHHIQLIVVGDFCQLPPVIAEDSCERELLQEFYKTNVGQAFAFQAPGWKKMGFINIEMHDVVRQQDDDFVHYLDLLRRGDPSALTYFNTVASFEDDPNATKICARNDDVDRLNEKELAKIPGEMITFPQQYYGSPSDRIYNPPSVSLKIGAKVIILTNQAIMLSKTSWKKGGIYNGSIGIVMDAKSFPDRPEDDFVIVSSGGQLYCIERKTDEIYSHRVDSNGKIIREVVGNVTYMPVKPGYAMTIHRSQGQTFDSIVLDPSCWDSGQLYVAISRLRSIKGLHLTRKINIKDLHLSPIVKELYDHLDDRKYMHLWEKDVVDIDCTKKASDMQMNKILQFPISCPKLPLQTETLKIEKSPIQDLDICSTVTKELAKGDPETMSRNEEVTDPSEEKASKIFHDITEEKHDVVDEIAAPEPVLTNTEVPSDRPEPVRKKNRGRPARYTNTSKVCRIPVELVDEIKMMLWLVCPKGGVNTTELMRFKMALRELCDIDRKIEGRPQ